MRYSEIVGPNFYYIKYTRLQAELIDAHYLAAAHHRARFLECSCPFHFGLFAKHVLALLRTVADGDFAKAKDPLDQGFERPDQWYKSWFEDTMRDCIRWRDIRVIEQDVLPDAGMFDGFPADRRFALGEPHDYDFVLENPEFVSEITTNLFRKETLPS